MRSAVADGTGERRLLSRAQLIWLAAALATIAVAVFSPLDAHAERSLTAHMVQHVLLLVVAAPALALGIPLPRILRYEGPRWGVCAGLTLVLQSAVMWAWHAPVLYEAAVRHTPVHVVEHGMFLLSAALFWWSIGLGPGRLHGGAIPIVFIAALPGTALGAALTLSNRIWYVDYPSITDQQMAGVVMWAFGGLFYVLAAAALFGAWLAAADRTNPARPAVAGATQ